VTRALGECLISAKLMETARTVLEEGAARYADLPDEPVVLGIQAQLARLYLLTDHDREAVRVCDAILERAEHGGHLAILADVLVTKGTGLGAASRTLEGGALVELAARIADEQGLMNTRFRALNNRLVLTGDVDPRDAYQTTLEGMALARKVGSAAWARNFAGNFGFYAYRVGEWDVAERELRTILDEDLEPGDAALVLNNLLSVVVMRGEPHEQLLQALEDVAAHLPPQQSRPLVPDSLGFVALAEGRYAEAADLWLEAAGEGLAAGAGNLLSAATMRVWAGDPDGAREAIASFDALHLNLAALVDLRDGILGALAIAGGRTEEGVAAVDLNRRRLVELSLPEDAARLAITAGIVGGADEPAVADGLREAREFLVAVRAAPLLAICDRLLGAGTPAS
jgi:hypothetical protein